MLKNKTFIAVFIKCLLMPINAGTMLNKGRISYLLVLNQRWAVRGSRAFSAGLIKIKWCEKMFLLIFGYHFHLCNVYKIAYD